MQDGFAVTMVPHAYSLVIFWAFFIFRRRLTRKNLFLNPNVDHYNGDILGPSFIPFDQNNYF